MLPRFYGRTDGVPTRWLTDVRHTLAELGPKVQATRMVKDYINDLYTPVAASSRALQSAHVAGELAGWKSFLRQQWGNVAIDHVEASAHEQVKVGDEVTVRACVSLGSVDPSDVRVELNYGKVQDDDSLTSVHTLTMEGAQSYEDGRHQFVGVCTVNEPGPFGYTVRIMPQHEHMDSPAELGLITVP